MTAAAKKILEDALSLTQQERVELIEALADSIVSAGQAEIDEAWRTEILERVEQVRNGEVTLESWADVRRKGQEALAGQ